MTSALGITILLMSCIMECAFELLPAPENVTLESEDFFCILTWATRLNSEPMGYQIEIIDRGFGNGRKYKNWTQVNKTCEILGSCWKCDLSSYFNDPHLSYRARVRAVREGYTSDWTISKELQLYRDVTLGPPEIMLIIHNQKLQVTVTTKISPLKNENGVFQRVHKELKTLWYHISIYEEHKEVDQNRAVFSSEKTEYISSRTLKPSTVYCALVIITLDHKSANATQCITTPSESSGILLIGLVLACPVLLSCVLILYCIVKYVNRESSTTPLPSVLQELVTKNMGMYPSSKMAHNVEKVDSILLYPLAKLSHDDDLETESEITGTHHILGEYHMKHDTGFQSKGFGQSYCDSKAYSGTNLSLLSTISGLGDSVSGDCTSFAAGLLQEAFQDHTPHAVHTSVHHQIHSKLLASTSEENGGHMVQSKGPQALKPLPGGNVGAGRYQDTEETLQCKLNIPLHSVMFQVCVDPADLRALHEFYDTGSEESTEENSLPSQSVGSGHHGKLQHSPNHTSFSAEGSNYGYESRPIIIHTEIGGASLYQLCDQATDS